VKDKFTDFGFTKVKSTEKQKRVDAVFHSVAHRYDLMNDLMSLGIHRLWKRHAVSRCQIRPHHHVLDLACGTGDLSLLIAPKLASSDQLTLCDINHAMLSLAKTRLIDQGIIPSQLIQANAEVLPFPNNAFDRIMIGFGLRNVTDKDRALSELYRILKPAGRLIILEFSHPIYSPLAHLYDAYSFHVLPQLGEWVANDPDSYRYLAESIRMHPDQEALKALILQARFDSCDYQNMTGGIVAIHQGLKFEQ
jgi:demethylmenaquinone methyltransferase/2-methoxy-6-polyprenyl-1,4-benzoquinol methylase